MLPTLGKNFVDVNVKADNPDYWLQAAETVPYLIAKGYSPQGAAATAIALQYMARKDYEAARPPGDFFGNVLRDQPEDYLANNDWLAEAERITAGEKDKVTNMSTTLKQLTNLLRQSFDEYDVNWAFELNRMIKHTGYQ